MKQRLTLLFSLFVLFQISTAQTIVSVTYLETATAAQLANGNPFLLSFLEFDVDSYRVIYTTDDLDGNEVEVSGLLTIPNDPGKQYPLLVYQHGTSGSPEDVPSDPNNGNAYLTQLYSSLGYVGIAPDLLGLGVHEGIHPYVHADSEAWVAADMIRAVRSYADNPDNELFINDQIFVTGYSQGGHSSMALHREIESNLGGEMTVTAGSHQSGPYSISGVMRELLFTDEDYGFVAYLPNTALAMQAAYGNIYNELSDIFKPQYIDLVQQFADDELNLFDLNEQLIDSLLLYEGVAAPGRLFLDSVIDEVQTNPDHPVNLALKDNDVYDWAPQAPTRILYCMADDQVPFMNSIIANDTMQANGAAELITADVSPTSDHVSCVEPAIISTIFFFGAYQLVEELVNTENIVYDLPFEVFPNPVDNQLNIKDLPISGRYVIYDVKGQIVQENFLTEGDHQLDMSTLNSGAYYMQIIGESNVFQHKIMKR